MGLRNMVELLDEDVIASQINQKTVGLLKNILAIQLHMIWRVFEIPKRLGWKRWEFNKFMYEND